MLNVGDGLKCGKEFNYFLLVLHVYESKMFALASALSGLHKLCCVQQILYHVPNGVAKLDLKWKIQLSPY